MKRIIHHRLMGLACGLLLAAGVSYGTTLVRMDLDRLTSTAAVVARARCLAVQSNWDSGHIWTWTTFETVETLKGALPRQFTVRLIGGKAGSKTSTVDGVPRFRPGEEVILFLELAGNGEFTVLSWVQGTFRIGRDPASNRESVTQDTSGLSMFDPATGVFRPGGIRNLPIEQFRQRVAEAVAGGAAKEK